MLQSLATRPAPDICNSPIIDHRYRAMRGVFAPYGFLVVSGDNTYQYAETTGNTSAAENEYK